MQLTAPKAPDEAPGKAETLAPWGHTMILLAALLAYSLSILALAAFALFAPQGVA